MSLDVTLGEANSVAPAGTGGTARPAWARDGLALPLAGCWLLVGVVYATCLLVTHHGIGATTTAYYNDLLSALWHGRTDVNPAVTFDLSRYQGHWYLYWGPTPVLFVLPFYAVSHLQASDILYGFVAGALNVAVFSGCIVELDRYFRLDLGRFTKIFVILNFAFISPNFYLSLGGMIWQVNQVIAIFYVLVFYYAYLRYLNERRWRYLLLASVFFNLAWMARYSLVFNGVLFGYLLVVLYREDPARLRRAAGVIAVVTAITLVGFFGYNQARFGNPLEIGYRFQVPAQRFASEFAANRMFSIAHVPHNATYYFLNHVVLRFEKPFLTIDPEGNSVFSVYPLVIVAFYLLARRVYTPANRLFLALLGSALAANLVVILLDLGTGWVQFGSRYFFDLIPGLFLAILFVVDRVNRPLRVALLTYGMYVNILGALLYYGAVHW